MSLKQYSKEQLLEMSLIEMAYDLLVERNEPIPFKDLISELASLHHLSKAEVEKKIAQFYTDLNVDGRFTSLGDNRWGLKTWYPVDQIEEEVVHVVKPKKKKKAKKAAVVIDDFDELEDEDLDFEEDIDDLDEDEDDDDDDILGSPVIDEVLLDDEVDDDDDLEEEIIEDDAFVLEDDEDEDEDEDDLDDLDKEDEK
ncbi:DNA-directed RNA polymerase subunit delta [Peribacillus simplex]|uniref:DNA-directed RNA polymerase subunit delta n=1 Tax=Peribacillus simplex TaxID=1478 RepID=UPI0011DDA1D7|nr:DNA-directed RNA polymerase subunit delta [Peribacillus simplex]